MGRRRAVGGFRFIEFGGNGVMERKELLPCPFCGGKAEKQGQQINGINYLYVTCTYCGALGPIMQTKQPRIKDEDNPAIEAWNRRVEITNEKDNKR